MASLYSALLVLFGLSEAYGAHVKDYCKVNCKEGKHTMCTTYYKPGGANCTNFKVYIKTKEMLELIDDVNEWRNTVALGKLYDLPPASNMIELHWDDEAASIATRWAEQCDQVVEDQCRRMLLTSRDDGGQCLASTSANGLRRTDILRNMMDYWFSLGQNLTNIPDSIDIYRSSADDVKYFTQLAWAQTDRIGCGISERQIRGINNENDDVKYKLVCNLYAMGNVEGRAVYLRGKPCSACPAKYSHCSDRYAGLCTYKPKAPSRSSRTQCLLTLTVPLSFLLILTPIGQQCC